MLGKKRPAQAQPSRSNKGADVDRYTSQYGASKTLRRGGLFSFSRLWVCCSRSSQRLSSQVHFAKLRQPLLGINSYLRAQRTGRRKHAS